MDRITVAKPGNDPVPPSRGSGEPAVHLLAVGSIVPRKGYDILVAALAEIRDLRWRLSIVGDPTRDADCSLALDRDIDRFGLRSCAWTALAPFRSRSWQRFDRTDLFVLPSRFEGYGMAFADAIAFGVPVIAARAGAVPETVPAQASILVPPDDAASLASALRRIIENRAEYEALRAQARAAAQTLPTWRESADVFARAIGMATNAMPAEGRPHERLFGGLAGAARAL